MYRFSFALRGLFVTAQPFDYVDPIKSEISAHLDVRQRIGVASAGSVAGLFINPGGFDLEALGQLFWGEYFFHRRVVVSFCASGVQTEVKAESSECLAGERRSPEPMLQCARS